MTFIQPFPSLPFQRGGSDPARRTTPPSPAAEPAFSDAGLGDLPQWQKDWEEEEDRQLAAKFLQAVNRITQQGIEAAVRTAQTCPGCSHPSHAENACNVVPLFSKEKKCGCWEDS